MESVDFVDVYAGNILWSKSFELSGKARQFDCYIMNYYDLVRIVLGKDEDIYLTNRDGREVSDIEPYFNKKKYLSDRKHATTLNIPEKNMYVIMQGETSKGWSFLGAIQGISADIPSYKMNFFWLDEDTATKNCGESSIKSAAFLTLSIHSMCVLTMPMGN
ncbi:MAG: hypothetical protein IPH45_20860 [Bacteroidales bacterium]|nr:hypothetical protein [Bacteroidales bacterium]